TLSPASSHSVRMRRPPSFVASVRLSDAVRMATRNVDGAGPRARCSSAVFEAEDMTMLLASQHQEAGDQRGRPQAQETERRASPASRHQADPEACDHETDYHWAEHEADVPDPTHHHR